MPSTNLRTLIRQRLADEVGRIPKQAPLRICLAYPSPYHVAMSSLGFQRVYRALMDHPDMACERAFLPDEGRPADEAPITYESLASLSDFPVVAISVAYELEIAGVIRLLQSSRIPPLRQDRDRRHPLILAGGPLTFSNPLPLAPFVDVLILGEAEALAPVVCEILATAPSRHDALASLARLDHVFIPELHGDQMPPVARVDDAMLPAYSAIRTPHTELSDMFLIETERGCSRGCSYCVMRRSTNGGMRIVPKDVILGHIPSDARRVGLVGAAVSDHPKIVEIVRELAEQGREVGLSSLRPDRLSDDFVAALKLAGYRTLTTAMDGPSERLRDMLERRARVKHLVAAAERARTHGMDRLKLYLMIGLPTETDDDIDECIRFTSELSKIIPVALGIAPFCAKRNTPLDGAPFAGISTVDQRLERLRKGLRGRVDVRSTSARWAWVEYVLAQGGIAEGRAVLDAVQAGGTFAAYRRAFEAIPSHAPRRKLAVVRETSSCSTHPPP
ncbi:MAG: radical SAM protein [Myxococcales bacterium]|nr:B12-binding domain-containing radical SAM protein [Polyangiaceae bacterium]MDW8249180.1 radical SAM protein [Myxococcales bacterium]